MDRSMSKLEETLEIKALRRVISAYLNYADASEHDVRRWERSYSKLRPHQQELLSHLPKKYEELRRCISTNSWFILNMLQAFEPPFDMSQNCEVNQENLEYSGIDRHIYSDKSDLSATITGIDLNVQCGPKEKETNGQSILSSNAGLKSLKERAFVNENWSQSRMADNREATESVLDKSEAAEEITSKPSTRQESNAGQCMEHDFGKDLNRINQNGCSGSQSECIHEMEHTKGYDSQSNLSNDREVTFSGIDFQDPVFGLHIPPADVDKVRCIIRNIVRDWTAEGAVERDQCYKPILQELNRYFPNRSRERPPCCLVPGAGLARLACEISRLGFISQGNEFSYYMLICSSFILNNTQAPLEWMIHPWIHSNCNMTTNKNQLRPVYFPDLHPGSAGITDGFSMCAGDFVEVYSHIDQKGTWDAVVTCFFIDTAHNIVDYIEIIAKILKSGGIWINIGPLLYHFAEPVSHSAEEEMSVELSLEDVKNVAFHYGFKLQREEIIETTYTAYQCSMIQSRYFAAFWTMTKSGNESLVNDVQD